MRLLSSDPTSPPTPAVDRLTRPAQGSAIPPTARTGFWLWGFIKKAKLFDELAKIVRLNTLACDTGERRHEIR